MNTTLADTSPLLLGRCKYDIAVRFRREASFCQTNFLISTTTNSSTPSSHFALLIYLFATAVATFRAEALLE